MPRNVKERKRTAIRSREVVGCFDDDLDCFIAGIHFDMNLCISKIYFVSAAITAADDGVRHMTERLPMASRGIAVETSLIRCKAEPPMQQAGGLSR